MKIRKATPKDLKIILKFLNSDENLTGHNSLKYKEQYVKEYIRGKTFKTFVYEDNGKILGITIAEFFNIAKQIYLDDLIIDKKHRGFGIGKKLINFIENLAKKNNYSLLYGYTEENNKKVQEFLAKNKYKRGKKFFFFFKEIK